jgi:hypothetical protein
MTVFSYGSGAYGTTTYGYTYDAEDIVGNWPYDQIVPDEGEAIYDLLISFEHSLDHVSNEVQNLKRERFLDTASNEELEKLAAEVGITRQTNEDDERLRLRAVIARASTRSDGTVKSEGTVFGLAEMLYVIFGDQTKEMQISSPGDHPVVQIEMPSDLIDEIPLTIAELEDALVDIIPAGDALEIITTDTWLLGESGSQGIGEGELT